MNQASMFMSPERVVFGTGCVQQIGELALELGQKAFVVTDNNVHKLDIFKTIEKSLKKSKLEYYVYSEVDANPTDVQVEKGADVYRHEKADILIGVGGGSAMDSAKAIGILIGNGGAIRDYDFDSAVDFSNVKTLTQPIPPLITIPTTAGTGAEVTAWAVVTNTKDKYKFFPGGWQAIPKIALVDPLMMESMPPLVTATTGMDALCHAIEAIASPYAMSQTDAFAFSAINHIVTHIGPAVANGSNIEARKGMALGAMEAGLSMNAWCGGVHALGHQLSTQADMPHGMAMGLMMPSVMAFNLMACPDRYADIAHTMGEKIDDLNVMDAAAKAPKAVKKLLALVGLPTSLKECGIDKKIFEECAKWAIRDSDVQGNPRTISYEQALTLFYEAYDH